MTELAVIGMACRLPGAPDLEAYWNLVERGETAVQQFPSDRLDRALYYHWQRGSRGKTYSTIGGLVPDIECDPDLDEFPANLICDYGPAYRHLLAVVRGAFLHAGIDPYAAAAGKVGLFAAHAHAGPVCEKLVFSIEIEDTVRRLSREPKFMALPSIQREQLQRSLIEEIHRTFPRRRLGGAPFDTPAKGVLLAHKAFGWSGPAVAVDAACASSLMALTLAADSLEQGDCEIAIVAAASRVEAGTLILFSQAQALGDSGSFPFDGRANGFLASDGYCAVIVQPLEKAVRAGRRIAGVIRSIGVSTDGRGRSLWAPRFEGQVLAIQKAWGTCLSPDTLQYVEAHAASTPVGDQVELRSLAAALGSKIPAGRKIPLASVKANIGHCKETAGLAGLIKVLLAIEHGVIPPAAGFETPQPGLDWETFPFFLPREPVPWEGIRRAAIDSFGIGGLNAHVIVEAYAGTSPHMARDSGVDGDEVVVIGRGCVLPGARNITDLERLMRSGESRVVPVPNERWNLETYLDQSGGFHSWRSSVGTGGFLTEYTYDWRRHKIPPIQVQHADPVQFLVLDAVEQALQEAGFFRGRIDRERVAVIVGTNFGSDFTAELSRCLQLPEFEQRLSSHCRAAGVNEDASEALISDFRESFHREMPMLLDQSGSFTPSTAASRVARTFDLMAGAMAVCSDDMASIAALRGAINMLRSGRCDAIVCAAAERNTGISKYVEMASYGTPRPLGEGAVAVVLMRKREALASGGHQGIVRGCEVTRADDSIATDDPLSGQIGDLLGAAGMLSLVQATIKGGGVIRQAAFSGAAGQLVTKAPLLAMVFAGQGSAYPGMLRELVETCPEAQAARRDLDAALRASGLPLFSELAEENPASLRTDVLRAQLAVLGADFILYSVLRDAGLRPEVVAGHSYGEYAALVACGAITIEQAVRITRERSRLLIQHSETSGGLMAVSVGEEAARRLCAEAEGGVFVAIVNTDEQTIVGGSQEALQRFAAVAKRNRVATTALSVPRPYHTPLLAPMRGAFREVLEREAFCPPQIPFLSSLSARYLVETEELRDHLACQLTETVRYRDVIRRLPERERPLQLVEVGPGQVLTRLHRAQSLYAKGERVETFPTDHPVHGKKCLARVLALAPKPSKERTGFPEVEAGPEVLYFDATASRRAKNLARSGAEVPASSSYGSEASEFLIQFVCEQTGYPRSIVDLDADLEKDLGIDSIRKARMLAELRERNLVSFRPGLALTLEDFPTLRSILHRMTESVPAVLVGAPPALRIDAPERTERPAFPEARLVLSGDPFDMGKQHGVQLKQWIRSGMDKYHDLLGRPDLEAPALRALSDRGALFVGEAGLEELRGMAEALDVPLHALVSYNLALCLEHVSGCSQFVAGSGLGRCQGVNEDSLLASRFREWILPIAQERRPRRGIAHLLFGVAGRFGGINGMNAAGLTITGSLLLDAAPASVDSPGLFHSALVPLILETAPDLDTAIRTLRDSPRVGASSLLLTHPDRREAVQVEYDGERMEVREYHAGTAATNHSLLLSGSGVAPEHSRVRLERLRDLMAADSCEPGVMQRALRDRFDSRQAQCVAAGTMNTVNREDNIYSVLFLPSPGEAWWTVGQGKLERLEKLWLPERHRRHVLRTVSVSRDAPDANWAWQESAWITGESDLSGPLARALDGRGVRISDSSPTHLFLLDARLEDPSLDKDSILKTYRLCQDWVAQVAEQGSLSRASLTAVTSLGGDFGFSGEIRNPSGGALTGLLKSIRQEFPKLRIKAIDAPPDVPPDELAHWICEEVESGAPEVEVAYARGGRWLVRAISEPPQVIHETGHAPIPAAGSAWIVTGGARGITARAALELGKRYALRLHLIGTASLEDPSDPSRNAEISQNLAEFSRANVAASYHCCDVSNLEALATLLAQIRAKEPIRGILHGAGFEEAASFVRKQKNNVERTIASKALGAVHLMELTRPDKITHFLAFSSVSGRFGAPGQTDYSLASDLLNKLVQRYRTERGVLGAVAFQWPPWGEIGMAMRPESKAVLELAGQPFLSPTEGIAYLLAEVEAGCPEGEVLFATSSAPDRDRILIQPLANSLFDRVTRPGPGADAGVSFQAEIVLQKDRHFFIHEHQWQGKGLLPAAASAAMLLELADLARISSSPQMLRDFVVDHAVRVDREPEHLQIHAVRSGAEDITCRITRRFFNRNGELVDPQQQVASGSAGRAADLPDLIWSEPDPGELAWLRVPYRDRAEAGNLIYHGPSLRCLEQIALVGNDAAIGRVSAPRRSVTRLNLALLDACFVACGLYCYHQKNAVVLAHGTRELLIGSQPPQGERCCLRLRWLGEKERLHTFDLSLTGERGDMLLEARGCTVIGIGDVNRGD